ncbi:MAG: energy transducer TonB, partial [Sulfuritalea sp.]|nr:energy transducer TonB [Sulfuritalea sp.]
MERACGLVVVIALHAAALWGLWQHRLIPSPQEAMTLFVNFIAPPLPEKTPLPPKQKIVEKP